MENTTPDREIKIGDRFAVPVTDTESEVEHIEIWVVNSFGKFPTCVEYINFDIEDSEDTISHYHKEEFLKLGLEPLKS